MTPSTIRDGILCSFTGWVVYGPEEHSTPDGRHVVNFTVLVAGAGHTAGRPGRSKQRVRVAVWGALAEQLVDQVTRRARVHVAGFLTLEHWQAADGPPRRGLHAYARHLAVLAPAPERPAERITA